MLAYSFSPNEEDARNCEVISPHRQVRRQMGVSLTFVPNAAPARNCEVISPHFQTTKYKFVNKFST